MKHKIDYACYNSDVASMHVWVVLSCRVWKGFVFSVQKKVYVSSCYMACRLTEKLTEYLFSTLLLKKKCNLFLQDTNIFFKNWGWCFKMLIIVLERDPLFDGTTKSMADWTGVVCKQIPN